MGMMRLPTNSKVGEGLVDDTAPVDIDDLTG